MVFNTELLAGNYVTGQPAGGFTAQYPCMQWVKQAANAGDASFEKKCRNIFVPTRSAQDVHNIVANEAFQQALRNAEFSL